MRGTNGMEYLRKPEWLKVEKGRGQCGKVSRILMNHQLNSVCSEAGCPNQGECFQSGTATFMLLGKFCTRNCTFCQIAKGNPEPADESEPDHVAEAAREMGLTHVVITSVTRDDLPDGGAGHFARTIRAVRREVPQATIEVLIPDFNGDEAALKTVMAEKPVILNHNVETVPELYEKVRPKAIFERSVELLSRAKNMDKAICTKSGFMVGLGETDEQVFKLLETLHQAGCDMVTIGQYLQPSRNHYQVKKYVHPDVFERYRESAYQAGISCVASGPLVRSSYHAQEDYLKLKQSLIQL
jgi:lipoic acid synthetase